MSELYTTLKAAKLRMLDLEAAVEQLETTKDGVYKERNQLLAFISKVRPSSLERHIGKDWEDDWRWIVFINIDGKALSWHIHDSELDMFNHLVRDAKIYKWDGHTNEEKYQHLSEVKK